MLHRHTPLLQESTCSILLRERGIVLGKETVHLLRVMTLLVVGGYRETECAVGKDLKKGRAVHKRC